MQKIGSHPWLGSLVLAVAAVVPAQADVTVHENIAFDGLGFVKMHGTLTEYTTADKQRKDSEMHCEGFLKYVCGNNKSGEIVRLDRELMWSLEPDKKLYRESAFPTAEQRAVAMKELEAQLDKMKSCQQKRPTAGAPDQSKCTMSPPKLAVNMSDEHATVAGHDTRKTSVTLTQTCTDKQTGDACDFVYGFDVWLTPDDVQGAAERKAFVRSYMHKLGLDDKDIITRGRMQQFLGQYAGTIKELATKAEDFKGTPLKTTFRMAFGGEHCAAAQQARQQGGAGGNLVGDAGSAAGSAATQTAAGEATSAATAAATRSAGNSVGGSIAGSAVGAFGSKLIGGLLSKKSATKAQAPGTGTATPPGTVQFVEFTNETTSIETASIPASEFDKPAGWKLEEPKPGKKPEEFSCPAGG